MLDEIRKHAKIQCGLGFGAMIGLLTGGKGIVPDAE